MNAVNVLQAIGFLSRTRGPIVNQRLGLVIAALTVPATAALIAQVRARIGWLNWVGPAFFDAFVAFMLVVDYLRPIEFRSPMRPEILIPFLVLYFGSILLMGLPMYRSGILLWAVTVCTTAFLLGSMFWAMRRGVG